LPKKEPIELLRSGGLLVRDNDNVVYFIPGRSLDQFRRDDLKGREGQKAVDAIFASFKDKRLVDLKNAGLFKFIVMCDSGDGPGD